MDHDIFVLIVGAILGFVSALLIELVKNRLESRRLNKERHRKAQEESEKNLREFLASPPDKKICPAWLTLIKTNNPLFQKSHTDNPKLAFSETPCLEDNANPSAEPALEKFLLSQAQIIGRDEDCEIQLSDSTVSRLHAMIKYEEGEFVIYDLGSKSGTFVNDKQVNKKGTILKFCDRLTVGESVFVFQGSASVDPPAATKRKNEATVTKPPRTSKVRHKKS